MADPQPTQSPSPSPPPEAPIPLTPGHRASGFIRLYNDALDKTLQSMSYENFAACFPTIASNAGEALRGMHGDVVERLGSLARAEFQKIILERAVIPNLNILEDLISDARKRSSQSTSTPLPSSTSSTNPPSSTADSNPPPKPPHTLPAQEITRAHEVPVLIAQNSQLNARIQTVAARNAGLLEEIRRQREEIEELLAGIEGVVGEVERAGGLLVGGERGEGEVERNQRAREAERVLVGLE